MRELFSPSKNEDLILMRILKKWVSEGKLYLFPNRWMPSNSFILFLDSCSYPASCFFHFLFYSWVKLCCRGCLPVSWSKPLFKRANLNIFTMLAPWWCIPGDFSLGLQMVLRSLSVAQTSLMPGFGVSLETCSCETNLVLSKRGWILYPSLSQP